MKKIIEMALNEAKKAFDEDELPIGCVIFKDKEIISVSHNTKNKQKCCINHAEINAIVESSFKIGDWRLNECEMFVTLEPCRMCMEAIRQSRIKKVYYLLNSNFENEDKREIDVFKTGEIEQETEYSKLLKKFFSKKR